MHICSKVAAVLRALERGWTTFAPQFLIIPFALQARSTSVARRLPWLVGALMGCVNLLGATAQPSCAAAFRHLSRGQS